MSKVPCNGCTLCCKGDAVRILPGDDPTLYQTVPHPLRPGELMLDHRPNGDCIYLGEDGCTIHAHKPQMCREMDCRRLSERITFTQARKLAAARQLPLPIWRRGRELLKQRQVGTVAAEPPDARGSA